MSIGHEEAGLQIVPLEIFEYITSFLDPGSLGALRLVCKSFFRLLNTEEIVAVLVVYRRLKRSFNTPAGYKRFYAEYNERNELHEYTRDLRHQRFGGTILDLVSLNQSFDTWGHDAWRRAKDSLDFIEKEFTITGFDAAYRVTKLDTDIRNAINDYQIRKSKKFITKTSVGSTQAIKTLEGAIEKAFARKPGALYALLRLVEEYLNVASGERFTRPTNEGPLPLEENTTFYKCLKPAYDDWRRNAPN